MGRVRYILLFASRPNHTSYRKIYFIEFVANVLRDNMGMIIFDLRGCGGCQRPKTSYLGAHFGTLTQCLVHPSAPVLPTKDSPINFINYDSQPPFSLHILDSRTKPTGLDFQLSQSHVDQDLNQALNSKTLFRVSHSKV